MAHIPHQGRMCLLDEVLDWDEDHISCRSGSHREVDNPLRAHGRLGSACGVEYAAQAMAVHGALAAGAAASAGAAARAGAGSKVSAVPSAGFLAAIRDVRVQATRLDDLAEDLIVNAARVAGDERTALYEFEVHAGSFCVLSGRATVVLDGGRLQR